MAASDLRLSHLLPQLKRLSGGQPLYLVGGTLRDLFLSRPVKDLDLVWQGPVRAFGKRIADELGGSFFYLRESEETARIVFSSQEKSRGEEPISENESRALWQDAVQQIDLVGMRGNSIEDDLRRRDFAVNAMAWDVSGVSLPYSLNELRPQVIDPLNGYNDLQAGLIRRCSPNSLNDDPLRALRAVRIAAAFGWEIEPETDRQMRSLGEAFRRISAERVRDEVFQMLGLRPFPRVRQAVQRLDQMGLMTVALRGPARPNGPDGLNALHQVLSAPMFESHPSLFQSLNDYLDTCLAAERTRRQLLRLACLISPPGKEESLVSRLALSAAESQFVRKTEEGAADAETWLSRGTVNAVGAFRFFQRYGEASPSAFLLAAATMREIQPTALLPWLRAWFGERERFLPIPLLNGTDLMKAFRKPGGPWIATLLDGLQEAQVSGTVTTLDQAWEWVRSHTDETGL
jgi:tRNA nucleotidyltransferase/poly(A) polymerase